MHFISSLNDFVFAYTKGAHFVIIRTHHTHSHVYIYNAIHRNYHFVYQPIKKKTIQLNVFFMWWQDLLSSNWEPTISAVANTCFLIVYYVVSFHMRSAINTLTIRLIDFISTVQFWTKSKMSNECTMHNLKILLMNEW